MNRSFALLLCPFLLLIGPFAAFAQPSSAIEMRWLSTYNANGGFLEGAAEISTYDAGSQRLFFVNGSTKKIDVLDIANPLVPAFLFSIDVLPYGAAANSVVAFDGYLAAAIEADIKQDPGVVVIFDINGTFVAELAVGALPDMIGISPDHHLLMTANEGEPSDDYLNDPEGSVSIIDITNGVATVSQGDVTTLTFDNYEYIRNSFNGFATDNLDYTASPAPYSMGANAWSPVTSQNGRSAVHGTHFWGLSDIDNMQGGGNFWHTLSFNSIDESGRPYSEVSFLYYANGFDVADSLGYIIEFNGGTEWNISNYVTLPNTPATGWQRITIPLADADGDVRIQLMAKCVGTGSSAGFEDVRYSFLDASTRIFGNNGLSTVRQDMEPEYIAFTADNTKAFATCQENNCVVLIDLITKSITNIKGLGFKDHNVSGKGFDATDQDGMINIIPRPTLGIYQPDAIDGFTINGEHYFVSANEGDTRDYDGYSEEVRVSSRNLDATAYPNGAVLKQNSVMGRLKTTTSMGDIDYDGDVDQIYSFGARSFSIWNEEGELVFDSGDQFEQYTAVFLPTEFNSNNEINSSLDNRSDDKGPEPEGVKVLEKYGRQYAFVCLERIGGVMVYDVTNPSSPQFIQYLNNRNFAVNATEEAALDLGPEGILLIPASISPNERDLLVTSNEVSGTVSIFQLDINRIITGDMLLETFDLNVSDTIGLYNDEAIYEGGVSGLFYKEGSENEFYVVGDRGPNADALNNELAMGATVLFPFPQYAPKIHEIQTMGEEFTITNTTTIKRLGGADASGIPLPWNAGSTGEAAWSDLNSTPISPDAWGIDSEGIALGNDGNFWVCDEYGSSIWKLNENGEVLERFTPFPNELEDMPLDSMIGKRRANRGFEGIAWTPDGKVYSILQSPVNNPNAVAGNASRIHRIVQLDPTSGTTQTFVYMHKPEIGEIRERDWKIGDLVAINNTEFLLLEHAERNGWNYKNVIKISLENATPITSEDFNGMTLEQLISEDSLNTYGIVPAARTPFLDLLELGWNTDHDKPEGLAIMNDSTIAVINDNDFGINSPLADGVIVMTGKQTRLYIYHLNPEQHLDYVSPYCTLTVNLNEAAFCEGGEVELMASGEFETFDWNTEEQTAIIVANETGEYQVSATTVEGCVDLETISVVEYPLPVVELGENFSLCPDSITTLVVENIYTSLLWNGVVGDTSYAVVANELALGDNEIIIQVENEFACLNMDTIVVFAASIPVIQLEDEYGICEGGEQMLATGNTTDAHVWSNQETGTEIFVSETGQYSVMVTNEYGCVAMDATTLNVWQNPTVELGDDVEVCDTLDYYLTIGDYDQIDWSTGSDENSILITESGSYSVTVANEFGCSATDEVQVTIVICIGVEEGLLGTISIYPNPSNEHITLNIPKGISGPVTIAFTDMSGRMVSEANYFTGLHTLDISGLSAGLYNATIQSSGLVAQRKIMVE